MSIQVEGTVIPFLLVSVRSYAGDGIYVLLRYSRYLR